MEACGGWTMSRWCICSSCGNSHEDGAAEHDDSWNEWKSSDSSRKDGAAEHDESWQESGDAWRQEGTTWNQKGDAWGRMGTPPIWQRQARWLAQNPYADNTMRSPFVQEMILHLVIEKWRKAAERSGVVPNIERCGA